jgi:SAM-dependent methyltransferase
MPERSEEFNPEQYWQERLEPFDLAAVGYQDLGVQFNRWVYRARRHVFRRLLGSLEQPWKDKRVLDVGSGTGFYVAEWLQAGTAVTGSDITRVAVERLTLAIPGVEFVQWDVAEEPPFPAAAFDAVSAFDVFFHIVDDSRYRSAFAHIAGLLKEGGYFLFSEMLVHGKTVRVTHQASRPLTEVEALLRANDLEIIARSPMLVIMNSPIDSANPVLRSLWRVIEGVLVRAPRVGGVVGAILYPIELFLGSHLSEGPSTEVIVCRKRTG